MGRVGLHPFPGKPLKYTVNQQQIVWSFPHVRPSPRSSIRISPSGLPSDAAPGPRFSVSSLFVGTDRPVKTASSAKFGVIHSARASPARRKISHPSESSKSLPELDFITGSRTTGTFFCASSHAITACSNRCVSQHSHFNRGEAYILCQTVQRLSHGAWIQPNYFSNSLGGLDGERCDGRHAVDSQRGKGFQVRQHARPGRWIEAAL